MPLYDIISTAATQHFIHKLTDIANAALPLKAEDVERLFELKKEHYRIWKAIGTELGIDVDILHAIEKDHTDDKDCLHAVIDSANPALTREAMTQILESANITNAIAGSYKNYNHMVLPCTSQFSI